MNCSDSENWIQLGSRIQTRRLELGLTQKQLADMLGISNRKLSRLECGDRSITVEMLSKLSVFLNVPISYFIGHLGFRSNFSAQEAECVYSIQKLDVEAQQAVFTILDRLSNKS